MIETLAGKAWDVAATAGPFIVILMVIVFVHELGHYWAGRWCRIAIASFAVGFGRELVGFTDKRGVRWKIGAIPLGGAVKFSEAAIGGQRGFSQSPVSARAFVVLAGPLANFILAFVLYLGLFLVYGDRESEARIGGIMAKSPAALAGLKRGDLVTHVDGLPVASFAEMDKALGCGSAHRVTVNRAGAVSEAVVTPRMKTRSGPGQSGLAMCETGISRNVAPVIGTVVSGLPADKAGLRSGDRVLSVEGEAIATYDDLVRVIFRSPERGIALVVQRGGAEVALAVTPMSVDDRDFDDQPFKRGRIGVSAQQPPGRAMGPGEAIAAASKETVAAITSMAMSVWTFLATPHREGDVAGPIAMAGVTGDVMQAGFDALVLWMALLSANLGVFNLLPIPVLDGGHLVLFGFEAARGRPLSERIQMMGVRAGLAIILALMVYVNALDILRLGRKLMS